MLISFIRSGTHLKKHILLCFNKNPTSCGNEVEIYFEVYL
jgi:hypothetical protein